MNLLKISEKKIVNLDLVTNISYQTDATRYINPANGELEPWNGGEEDYGGSSPWESTEIPLLTFWRLEEVIAKVEGEDATIIWTWLCGNVADL